jgi:rhamnosyltransferase
MQMNHSEPQKINEICLKNKLSERKTVDVSIVVRTYNEAHHINKLLKGIEAQSVRPREIIVVDSGSTDETVVRAKAWGSSIVNIDKNKFTFGRALNIGCAAAEGEILLFVSGHVYPTNETWLEQMLEPFGNPKTVLTYGGQIGGITNKFSEHQIFAHWFPSSTDTEKNSYFCNNANCAIRKSAWIKQKYDEELTGLEDLDWAKRAQKSGGKIVYVPDAKILHIHNESWRQIRYRYEREAIALKIIEPDASLSAINIVTFFTRNVLNDLIEAARQNKFFAEFMSVILFRLNQFFGAWKGFSKKEKISQELRRRFYYPLDRSANKAPRKKTTFVTFGDDEAGAP